MTRAYTLLTWTRNLLAVVGAVAVCIVLGLSQAGYFDHIDLGGAAVAAAWVVVRSLGKALGIVVVALVGGGIAQILYERMGGK